MANGPTIPHRYRKHAINHALDLIINNYKHSTNGVRMCVARRCEFTVSENMGSITLIHILLVGDWKDSVYANNPRSEDDTK